MPCRCVCDESDSLCPVSLSAARVTVCALYVCLRRGWLVVPCRCVCGKSDWSCPVGLSAARVAGCALYVCLRRGWLVVPSMFVCGGGGWLCPVCLFCVVRRPLLNGAAGGWPIVLESRACCLCCPDDGWSADLQMGCWRTSHRGKGASCHRSSLCSVIVRRRSGAENREILRHTGPTAVQRPTRD